MRAGGGGGAGVKPVEKLVQLFCLLCDPLDSSSPLVAGDLLYSIPNILCSRMPLLCSSLASPPFLPVGVLTLSEFVFELPFTCLNSAQSPTLKAPLLFLRRVFRSLVTQGGLFG